jgi:hypothetical protein
MILQPRVTTEDLGLEYLALLAFSSLLVLTWLRVVILG